MAHFALTPAQIREARTMLKRGESRARVLRVVDFEDVWIRRRLRELQNRYGAGTSSPFTIVR
jgi:hypothetical protein